MLLEDHTTLLLVAHALCALGTVALTTHLVVWMRPLTRNKFARFVACRRFALLALGAYSTTMLIGLLLYPTYKVRVRGEYFDNPSAIRRATEASAIAREMAQERHQDSLRFRRGEAGLETKTERDPSEQAEAIRNQAEERIDRGARIARWFDVKEHWSALGLALCAAVAFFFWKSGANKDSLVIIRLVWAMAILSASSAWAAAVIGLVTAAMRSVAAL